MHLDKKGFTLVGALMASVIMTIVMLAFSSYVRYYTKALTQAKNKAELVLDELQKESSTITRTCNHNDSNCLSECKVPIACMHNHANNKSVQTCDGDCTFVDGVWYKGGQACNIGFECRF